LTASSHKLAQGQDKGAMTQTFIVFVSMFLSVTDVCTHPLNKTDDNIIPKIEIFE
jgi:hypothetical protein